MDVRLERVSKRFGADSVVRDVDLVLPDRQFVSLLGPSGCGKTTLLRMIAGLETVSGGSIWFGERRMNRVPPGRRNVAMIFQHDALYPHMSVFGNIAYGLRVRGAAKPEIRERVQEAAGILEIDSLLDRWPRQLSGGQRRRVALGRAMARRPVLFLMDEPLSNLDAKLRAAMRAELKRFHLTVETTMLHVTHDPLEAMMLSDRIAVMSEGAVQQFGTPQEVYGRPANRFVAGFIGTPPMNMLEARLARDGAPRLMLVGGQIAAPPHLAAPLSRLPDGARLTLGIRPQDMLLGGRQDEGGIPARVRTVEPIGAEKLVELAYGATGRMTVQIDADRAIAPNEVLAVRFRPDRIHLFDSETGAAIRPD